MKKQSDIRWLFWAAGWFSGICFGGTKHYAHVEAGAGSILLYLVLTYYFSRKDLKSK